MGESESNIDYQEIAQLLVDYDKTVAGEFTSMGEPDALDAARELYEEHGPFELDWSEWAKTQPAGWYSGSGSE